MRPRRHDALFDKRLSQEEVWIRQGIKAAEHAMRAGFGHCKLCVGRRSPQAPGHCKDGYLLAEQSGKIVAEARQINLAFDDGKTVVKSFSTLIQRAM